MHQLRLAVGRCPRRRQPRFDQRHEGRQKGVADSAGKGEIGLPIAGVQIVIEDPANPARPVAVRDEEVFIGPCLEFPVIIRGMGIAGRAQRLVEMRGVLGVFQTGVQIGSAAEPPGVGGPEHPCVQMHRRAMRVDHMGDKADPACPEARIAVHPRHPARRHRLLRPGGQRAVDFRDVDPDLFKHLAAAHHAHHAAACPAFARPAFAVAAVATGRRHLEPARHSLPMPILQRLEGGDDPVAQAAKPLCCLSLFPDEILCHGIPLLCLRAMPKRTDSNPSPPFSPQNPGPARPW